MKEIIMILTETNIKDFNTLYRTENGRTISIVRLEEVVKVEMEDVKELCNLEIGKFKRHIKHHYNEKEYLELIKELFQLMTFALATMAFIMLLQIVKHGFMVLELKCSTTAFSDYVQWNHSFEPVKFSFRLKKMVGVYGGDRWSKGKRFEKDRVWFEGSRIHVFSTVKV